MTGVYLPGDGVANGDMEVEIGFPLLAGHIPHQGGDLIVPLVALGVILLLLGAENADGHVVGRADGGNAAQLHLLLLHQAGQAGDDLLARVQPQHIALRKFAIFHLNSFLRSNWSNSVRSYKRSRKRHKSFAASYQ